MSFLDERGRRTQLETLEFVTRRGETTPDEVAGALGGAPEHVGRRLRRYARRGWLDRRYESDGIRLHVRFAVRDAGAERMRWLRERATSDN